ncbi:MAG TPA: YraN family protein [Deinococcales bacterium]|nr:YraN family protein [Deinococcales bacterium]
MGGRPPGTRKQRDARSLTTPAPARGAWAEDAAVRRLEAAGLRVLARNWRCRGGELDVVARDRDGTLVFVEVKQRATDGYGSAAEHLVARKAALVRRAALQYMGRDDLRCRFDAVLVSGTEARHSLEWLKDAF